MISKREIKIELAFVEELATTPEKINADSNDKVDVVCERSSKICKWKSKIM